MKFSQEDTRKSITIGALYAALIFALAAYYNYAIPYDPDPVTTPSSTHLLLWFLLYLPLGMFTAIADWKVKDFGFSVNRRVGLVLISMFFLCAPIAQTFEISWQSALIEAFARTGEEVFFRGFLFLLVLKAFSEKARPWLWAVLISALVFALVHTQTFQSSYFENVSISRSYQIVQRLVDLFLVGAFIALLRHWTQSILPGVIVHSLVKGGVFTLPFSLTIYGGIVFWAYKRGELMLFEGTSNKGAA